jgi:hypothetical protein
MDTQFAQFGIMKLRMAFDQSCAVRQGCRCQFYLWVIKDLLPKRPPHSVAVMDNATFHNRHDNQEVIRIAGHTLLYLPAYFSRPEPHRA